MMRFLRSWKKVTPEPIFWRSSRHFRAAGLALAPTFIPFTPWTTRESYRELLAVLLEQDLVENVAPIQLALRLLIPNGSRLLESRTCEPSSPVLTNRLYSSLETSGRDR